MLLLLLLLQSSGSVKSLAKSVSEVSLNGGRPSDVGVNESPRTVTGVHGALLELRQHASAASQVLAPCSSSSSSMPLGLSAHQDGRYPCQNSNGIMVVVRCRSLSG